MSTEKVIVKVKKLHQDVIIPTKAHEFDSGFDLNVAETKVIHAGETVAVKTGLAFEIPEGYELQIRPRSGVSLKTPLKVIFGTVDCQYRGEVGIIVQNTATDSFVTINKGDRLAQGVFQRIPQIVLVEESNLSSSERGTNGFGSSGV